MILLLGATGYIGQAFARALRRRGNCFIPLSRHAFDYAKFDLLFDYVRKIRPRFVINAAGSSDHFNVDSHERARLETFETNTVIPQTVARVCVMTQTPWGHVSSGCIYSGAKVYENGAMRIERDLNRPELRRLYETHPEKFSGFTEYDEPNFSFRCPPCNFWEGTKALAEEALRGGERTYIWRPRIPFSERDEPHNLLTKLQAYQRVYDHVTSLSHVEDFARACLELVERQAPFGIYNVTNPGAVTTRQIVKMIERFLKPSRRFDYWAGDDEFYAEGTRTPRSSCILDVTKLLQTGVKMRPVGDALEEALHKWQPSAPAGGGTAPEFIPLVVK
jgi:UDP-glucose 4,6-dehydratase